MENLEMKYIIHLANKCIQKYDIKDYQLEFIRHNENITLKVTDNLDNSKYLLRIHEPISLNFGGIQHTFEGLNSEKAFLDYLNEKTDLILQEPVLNKYGEFVSVINDIERNKVILCTLLTWIEGEKYNKDSKNAKEIAFELGVVLGKLHQFSRNWKTPKYFIRPTYHANKYANLVNRLDYGVEIGLYKKEELNILKKTMNQIKKTYDLTDDLSDKRGIIHADTHTGNIIVNSSKVHLIDFSFSGYGYYALDIGIALTSLEQELRECLLNGYKTLIEVDEIDIKLINSSYLLSFFGAFAFNINNIKNYEWLKRKVNEVVNDQCLKILNDEMIINI